MESRWRLARSTSCRSPARRAPQWAAAFRKGDSPSRPPHGTFAGTFRVEITAVRKTGRKVEDRFGEAIDETEQAIPAQYNRDSGLTADVTEQGPNRFEFALQSK